MNHYNSFLLKLPLFSGLNEANMSTLSFCLSFRTRKYQKDEAIFLEGEKIKKVGIVLEGSVIIVKEDMMGNRNIVMEVKKGEVFGEAFVFANKPLTVSVFSVADSNILYIDGEKIKTMCSEMCEFHNQLISNMLAIIAEKNIFQNEKIDLLSKRSIRNRVLTFLFRESKRNNSARFSISLNRQEMADYLCVDRSALSSEIAKLKKEGILDYRKNDFILLTEQQEYID